MNKRTRLAGLLSIIAFTGIITGCNDSEGATDDQQETKTPVEVAEVSFGSLSDENKVTGTIIPEKEVNAIAKAPGELTKVMVEKGDIVKRGDTLAQIDATDERNALEQNQSKLKQAQIGLENAIAGKQKAQKNLQQSKASLRQAEASLDEAKEKQQNNEDNIEMDIENAKTALDQAKKNKERMEALFDDGLISKKDFEDADKALKDAQNAYDKVKLNKEQATSDVALASLEASVDQAEIGVDLAKSSIREADIGVEKARSSVEQAQLSVDSAKEKLQDKTIKAPISGEISVVNNEQGEMASNQEPFATIVSMDTVKLEVQVSPAQLDVLKKGDSAEIAVAGIDKNVTGTISYVASTSSDAGLFTVEAEIDNDDHSLRPGMVATLVTDEVLVDKSLLVPSNAVVQVEGKSVVFLAVDGEAVQKEVDIVRQGTESTAVKGDIEKGDQVVTSGQSLLEDGNSVKIMEED
ncbi:efflux RND transporter periplasmic adaptor subunit [Lentibacillus cibarius]|uniref:Efflux RND transporter periplasmic adaptor subunit n=1 Tax=Lentibacillus cibarius TaxID=2583219 RepID=A0A549YFI7_9BACI|nr:efflux RND transporter periplasmic adaptor subunit [Lentibacillus cibarius]TRM10652.1 efflux RND transporter periplasmic adaptor subunit [Lentibacillus cibarius]